MSRRCDAPFIVRVAAVQQSAKNQHRSFALSFGGSGNWFKKNRMRTAPATGLMTATVFVFVLVSAAAFAQHLSPENAGNLLRAKQGSVVLLPGFLSDTIPAVRYQKTVLPGPQYLISDDPEYIRQPEALALRETVQPGSVRVYLYNVNGVQLPQKMERKISVVIKNNGAADLHLRMLKYSSQPATANYFRAGKKGLADYFASSGEQTVRTIKPGALEQLDSRLENQAVKYDELAHGIYEFVIDQPAEISVVQTAPQTPSGEAVSRLKDVAPSRHSNAGRGLFGVSNYLVQTDTLATAPGAAALVLADGKTDPWVVGKDAGKGTLAKLAGNYGVMYTVEIPWRSTNGKGLALVTWNARAGNNRWCGGMAASVVVSEGKFGGGVVQLPSDSLRTRGAPEAVLIQVFPPAKNNGVQTIRLTYSPPGASCLPTPLVFIPVDLR